MQLEVISHKDMSCCYSHLHLSPCGLERQEAVSSSGSVAPVNSEKKKRSTDLSHTWQTWRLEKLFVVQAGQQEAAALWDKHRAAQDHQLAEARAKLEAALQEGSATQEALQVLQLETKQQVRHLTRMSSRVSVYKHEPTYRLRPVRFTFASGKTCSQHVSPDVLQLLLLLPPNKYDLLKSCCTVALSYFEHTGAGRGPGEFRC